MISWPSDASRRPLHALHPRSERTSVPRHCYAMLCCAMLHLSRALPRAPPVCRRCSGSQIEGKLAVDSSTGEVVCPRRGFPYAMSKRLDLHDKVEESIRRDPGPRECAETPARPSSRPGSGDQRSCIGPLAARETLYLTGPVSYRRPDIHGVPTTSPCPRHTAASENIDNGLRWRSPPSACLELVSHTSRTKRHRSHRPGASISHLLFRRLACSIITGDAARVTGTDSTQR